MVLSVVALAAVALVVADIAGMALLRSKLIERVDKQLMTQTAAFDRQTDRIPEEFSQQQQNSDRVPSAFAPDTRFYRYDLTGNLITSIADETDPRPLLNELGDVTAQADNLTAVTISGTSGTSWRVLVIRLPDDLGYGVSAVSLTEVQQTSDQLLLIDIAVTGLVLLILGASAAAVIRMGLRPLTRMQNTAETIVGGNLSQRVEDADPHTEAGRLGLALNTMLARIEKAVAEQAASEGRLRQVLADAAHELRTPLTSIQGFAELYRRGGAPPGPPLDEAMGRIESEVSRMRLLVNDMLLLARLDEERPLLCQPVDLLAIAADAVRDAHVRVPERFVRLAGIDDRRETFEPVTAVADEARIRQVVTNLIANALQHTPDEAQVVVRVGRPSTTTDDCPPTVTIGADLIPARRVAALEVVDTGPGMTAMDASRVFERLYRVDPSRSRRHGGAGLGLAIVASIVTAHGGKVELWTAPGRGARFRVLLPGRPPSVEGDEIDDEEDADLSEEFDLDQALEAVFDSSTGLQGCSEEA